MKRLLNHFLQIVVLGGILFLMVKLPLFKIPHIQLILTCLIAVLFCLVLGILGYHAYLKKGKIFLFLLFCCILGANNVYAWTQEEIEAMSGGRYTGAPKDNTSTPLTQEEQKIRMGADRAARYGLSHTETFAASGHFCMAAEEYSKNTFEAMQKNWVGDKPCSSITRNTLRQKLNELKMVPRVFAERDRTQKVWTSFRAVPSWNDWVQENFSKVSPVEREEMACAAVLNSMCSDYDERHPPALAKTVKQIMEKDSVKVGCWPCEMSFIILTVIQVLSSQLSKNMKDAGVDILQIFIFLWFLYTAFQALIFPSKGKTFIKDLAKMFLSSLVAFLLLFNTSYLHTLYSDFLSPIINIGLGLSDRINEVVQETPVMTDNFSAQVQEELKISQANLCTFRGGLSNQTGTNFWQNLSDRIFPELSDAYPNLHLTEENTLITPELESELLCMVQRMYNQFSPFVAIGQSLISFSFADGRKEAKTYFEDLEMWSVGWALTILFTIYSFLVAFRIIDIFLRLGFVLILIPLFITTAVFPITRSFTKNGFKFLINIISEFLGLALAVNFIILLFETGIVQQRAKLIEMINAPYSQDYGDRLLTTITSDHTLFFFFMLIALFFFGNTVLKSAVNLMNSVFGASVPGSDTGMVGAAAIGVAQMAGKLGKKTWDVSSKFSEKTSAYKPPEKSNKENKESTAAAPKKYFGEKTGNAVNRTSQGLAAGIDKIGVTAGKALQKTGIGAIIGVPLTVATKSLSTGIRAAGKLASVAVKAPGASVSAVKNAPQNLKNFASKIKNAYDQGLNGSDKKQ